MDKSEKHLKDFIYLDVDRVRSFIAQLYQGVPETFQEVQGKDTTKKAGVTVGFPGFASVDAGGNILYQQSATETRSAHHYLYSLLEQKLIELGELLKIDENFELDKWLPDTFLDGMPILIQGKVQVIDYKSVVSALEMIPGISKIASNFAKQTLHQQLQAGEINRSQYDKQVKASETSNINANDIKKISEVVDKLYSATSRVKVYPFIDDGLHLFVGSAIREFFAIAPSIPLVNSGLLSASSWYMMGIVNGVPSNSNLPHLKEADNSVQNIEDSLEQVVYAMQEINKVTFSTSFPAISVVPLAIYRKC